MFEFPKDGFEKRKAFLFKKRFVLKEKKTCFFGKAFFLKERFLVKVFIEGKKVVCKSVSQIELRGLYFILIQG